MQEINKQQLKNIRVTLKLCQIISVMKLISVYEEEFCQENLLQKNFRA